MNLHTSKQYLSHFLQGSVLLVLVVAASYVTIGRILISNVQLYRVEIETKLSEVLSVPVSIGSIQGSWSYLDPSVELGQVVIGVNNPVRVTQMGISIDTVASLREWMPVIKGFSATGLRLTVTKREERWGIEGLPVSDRPFNPESILTTLEYLSAFEVKDVEIQVNGNHSRFLVKSHSSQVCELQRDGDVRVLVLPLLLVDDNGESSFLLGGRYAGTPGDSTSEIYLNLPVVDALEFLPTQMVTDFGLDQLAFGAELWLSHDDDAFELRGRSQLNAGFVDSEHKLSSDFNFATRGIADGEVTAIIPAIQGEFAGVSWQMKEIGLAYEPGPAGHRLAVRIPELQIEELVATALKMGSSGLLLNEDQMDALKNLAPVGSIRNLMGVISLGQRVSKDSSLAESIDYRVTGQLDSVSVERYKALPVISDLNGLIAFGPTGGFLDMVNERPFSLQFPGLFENAWHFDSAKTRVTFDISAAGVQVQTGLVEAKHGNLSAMGRVHLHLPGDPLLTTWGLELGVQNANLLDAFRYLPNTLTEEIRVWFDEAILAGRSNESGMVFHGSLNKEADKDEKSHQLYFEVTDTILDYNYMWPRFDGLVASIFIDNFEISSNDASGSLYDSQVFESKVMVPISSEGVVDTILIDGNLRGDFSDGIRILNETPLVEATNSMAEGWVGTGEMSGSAMLNIPLGDRILEGEPTMVDLRLTLKEAELDMPAFDLQFSNINGGFRYESNTAVQSDEFTAQLFGESVRGNITSIGDIAGGEIIVNLSGGVDANDLYQWAGQPLLSRAVGQLAYESNLHVYYGNRSQEPLFVRAESDLMNVELNIPRPMAKRADEIMDLEYKQIFTDTGYRIELTLGEEVQANLKIVDGTLAGGRLHFGHEPMGAISFQHLQVSGELAHVVYEEWDQLTIDLEQISGDSLEQDLVQTLDAVDVTIGLFDVFGFEMENALTRITRSPDAWHVDLENEWLKGRVSVSDDEAVPLDIAMQKLMFESDLDAIGEDPLGAVAPGELAAARFSVEQLLLDGEDYGSWSFLYQPEVQGARLEELKVNVRGLQVADDASVHWQLLDGQHQSHFSGTVLVPDLAKALQDWGFASSIEGEDFRFYGDVVWPGTPAMVDLEIIDGLVRLTRGEGRFVQADSSVGGALRLLGIFDFDSLAKRFRFDFSDVVNSGFSFNNIEGETRFKSGIVDVVDPIVIVGSSSTFKVAGRVNLTSRELDNDMIVTLPVNRNLPWYAAFSAIATGPLAGAGVFLAQRVFQNQINAISSAKYKITGTMEEPIIEFVTIFSDSVRDVPEESTPTGE
ncbi:MAG: hypothetical protein ACI82A_000295 [Candidatus Azotimanducaceae bacterium]|jgi:uncharacterized protein (TIGR02099 family)